VPPPEPERKLPDYGMQVRADYVMFARFQFLRRLRGGARSSASTSTSIPACAARCSAPSGDGPRSTMCRSRRR
jgi:hypothetical protein